ncbi:hypothetical protein [Amphiplicatus metriothermophilus]|uniref:Iron complex outermembrane recepter protein n=1 Tax=Amphiplicatus metriothermophilus TaxID=1519374 RepID=A0A239PQD6_9PROT|nr:hypothetical protein [Amphiplicatus metriothermophilus]MBB5518717.1 hypothetical protein [Amphiplicatus metriothermophilus]SNT72126.1 hypothetical protein SAMN06297382_1159 [Amphiplicatus metriothermophilus]
MARLSAIAAAAAAAFVASSGLAPAKTVVVGPAPCPAPPDIEPYVPPADVAADSNADLRLDDRVLVLKDAEIGPELIGRFILDAHTGLPYRVEPGEQEHACGR